MDYNINKTVYYYLKEANKEIAKLRKTYNENEEKIKSNRYTPQFKKEGLIPKREELRRKLQLACEDSIRDAKNLVAQYRKDAAELDNLNPADITDDIKLLSPGIKLLPRDIQGMLKRNEDNRTMVQIIMRYAKENNLDVGYNVYLGGEAERLTADALDTIINSYSRWIDTDNADSMLEKFFDIVKE